MPFSRRDMIKVAHYYYSFGYNQQQVADKFGMSRQRVNRLLKQALAEGIVEIKVRDLSNAKLESELEVKFGLKEAVVVDNSDISSACIKYLKSVVQEGWKIGVASSTTIAKILRDTPASGEKHDIKVIQIMGGMNTNNISLRPDMNTVKLANIFGGEAYVLFAPAIVDNPGFAKLVKEESQVSDIYAMYSSLNIALVTVGALQEDNLLVEAGYLKMPDFYMLRDKQGVGDVVMRFFNMEGDIVDEQFDARVMSIPVADFKKIGLRVGVAYGEYKVRPIVGALNGNFINVLITDTATAGLLLEYEQ
ncbi:MAG: sugar-binding transcriptional regulator [Bacillota bacterium]